MFHAAKPPAGVCRSCGEGFGNNVPASVNPNLCRDCREEPPHEYRYPRSLRKRIAEIHCDNPDCSDPYCYWCDTELHLPNGALLPPKVPVLDDR